MCLNNLILVDLGQTIYIVVITLDAEVLCHIDNLHVFRNGVLLEESLALTMPEAEEHHIHLVERHIGSKTQVGVADESFVYIADKIACITLGVGEDNFRLRMVE